MGFASHHLLCVGLTLGASAAMADDCSCLARSKAELAASKSDPRRTCYSNGYRPDVGPTVTRAEAAELDWIIAAHTRGETLTAAEVARLTRVERTDQRHRAANLALGYFYASRGARDRQITHLEIAVRRGRYRHDARALFSLTKAHTELGNYKRALHLMQRVLRKMARVSLAEQAEFLRFRALLSEAVFAQQMMEHPARANIRLLDTAIESWERFKSIYEGPIGAAVATLSIARLRAIVEDRAAGRNR